jgi:hypothetical protein
MNILPLVQNFRTSDIQIQLLFVIVSCAMIFRLGWIVLLLLLRFYLAV